MIIYALNCVERIIYSASDTVEHTSHCTSTDMS